MSVVLVVSSSCQYCDVGRHVRNQTACADWRKQCSGRLRTFWKTDDSLSVLCGKLMFYYRWLGLVGQRRTNETKRQQLQRDEDGVRRLLTSVGTTSLKLMASRRETHDAWRACGLWCYFPSADKLPDFHRPTDPFWHFVNVRLSGWHPSTNSRQPSTSELVFFKRETPKAYRPYAHCYDRPNDVCLYVCERCAWRQTVQDRFVVCIEVE